MKRPSLKMPSLRRKGKTQPEQGHESLSMPGDIEERAQNDSGTHSNTLKSEKAPKIKGGGLKGMGKKKNPGITQPDNMEQESAGYRSENSGNTRQINERRDENSETIPLLSGQDAFIALGTAPSNMLPIATRRAHSPLHKGFYKKQSPKLKVYLDDHLQGRYAKVKLAIDAYLRIGFWRSHQMKRPYILLGGDSNANGVNLEIIVFRGGEVIEANEKLLPPADALDHLDVVEAIIEAIRSQYADCLIEQAGPLHRLANPHIKKYHGNKLFKGLKAVSLQPAQHSIRQYIAPAAITAGSLGYLVFTLTSGLSGYQAATREAEVLENHLFTLSSQTQSIDVMEARQMFKNKLNAPGKESRYVDQVIRIAGATQRIVGSEIKTLTVPNDGPGAIAGVLSLQVPSANYSSPLLQGREVLDLLAQELGQPVRLSRQSGITENDQTITFRIEVLNG
jgi:hypothetical protein